MRWYEAILLGCYAATASWHLTHDSSYITLASGPYCNIRSVLLQDVNKNSIAFVTALRQGCAQAISLYFPSQLCR